MPYFRNLIDQGAIELPITHPEMTRFMITLRQGVEFVLRNFERMQGGEIFVPKIASMQMIELAKALAPKLSQKVIGIRPGEKLHEIMCPSDDSHLTLEFDDHYVICPTIQFAHKSDFTTNALNEIGVPVRQGFEYNSGNNSQWLTHQDLLNMEIDK